MEYFHKDGTAEYNKIGTEEGKVCVCENWET